MTSPGGQLPHHTLYRLWTAGALDVLASATHLAKGRQGFKYALLAAIQTGAWNRVKQLVGQKGAVDGVFPVYAHKLLLKIGSLHCLLGQREKGIRALRRANTVRMSMMVGDGVAWDKAQIAALACGASATQFGAPLGHMRSNRLARFLLIDQKAPARPTGWYVLKELAQFRPYQRLSFLGPGLNERLLGVAELLAVAYPDSEYVKPASLNIGQFVSPWLLSHTGEIFSKLSLDDPVRLESGAMRLSALIDSPMAQKPIAPGTPSVLSQPRKWAREKPKQALISLQHKLLLSAASQYVQFGQYKRARKILDRIAPQLVPAERWTAGTLYLAMRSYRRADALYQQSIASPGFKTHKRLDRAALRLVRALALAGAGNFVDAYASALAAHNLANYGDSRSRAKMTIARATAWMVAAMSLKLNKSDPIDGLSGRHPDEQVGSFEPSLEQVAFWWHLATAPDEDKKSRRRGIESVSGISRLVLPAVMFVVAHAVERQTDPGVWLDSLFRDVAGANRRQILLARAEAMRWIGNPVAARDWQKRADSIHRLIKGYRTGILAQLAGL